MGAIADLTSWLFIPASQERFVRSALASGASVFILDLEDSIPSHQKADARAALPAMVAALCGAGCPIYVRVNKGDADDLVACAQLQIDGVMFPKAESAHDIEQAVAIYAAAGGRRTGFVAAIESALGVLNALEIARASCVTGLMFGTGDFVAETGFALTPEALAGPATMIALAANAAGIDAIGLPASIAEFRDLEALRVTALAARSLGYSGTPIIHPAQVATIHEAFRPTADEADAARRIVAAYEATEGGATAVQGKLIERPVYLQAQSVLKRAAIGEPVL